MTTALLQPRSTHLLVDPDNWKLDVLERAITSLDCTRIQSVIVGGTYNHSDQFDAVVNICRSLPVPLGNFLAAGPPDAMLSAAASFVVVPIVLGAVTSRFLADHVIAAAPLIRRLHLDIVRVAYLQLAGSTVTSAQFFTQTIPIPRHNPSTIGTLALAGRYLGADAVYLEAGSGANSPATPAEIQAAVEGGQLPVIVGGGLRSPAACDLAFEAGARAVIVGSIFEERGGFEWLATK